MIKRVEKVVEWIQFTQKGKRQKVFAETEEYYSIMDNNGDLFPCLKEHLKVVSEREVLEFSGLNCYETLLDVYAISVDSKIDLRNYDLKVIATPKDKTYEEMSKEELIKLLKSKE
jgi:hypothetical protein